MSDFCIIPEGDESMIYHCRLQVIEQEFVSHTADFKDIVELQQVEFETPEPLSKISGNINGRFVAIGKSTSKVYSWITV